MDLRRSGLAEFTTHMLRTTTIATGPQRNFFRWSRFSSLVAALLTILPAVSGIETLMADDSDIRIPRVTISLVRQSDIPARDSGMLLEIQVTEGQVVAKGDVVAILENQQQTIQLKAAELNSEVARVQAADDLEVQAAKAQLKEAESGQRVRAVALKIARIEADSDIAVKVASAETDLRRIELDRAKSARSSFEGSISESQIDRLKTSVLKGELETEQARNEYQAQQLKPEAEQAALDQQIEQIRRFQALVEQQDKNLRITRLQSDIQMNEVRLAQLKLEQRTIRAPFDGTIVKVSPQAGEWVEPGAPVARIIDLNTLRAEGFLPASQIHAGLVGSAASIKLASNGKTVELKGKVTFISPEVDPVNQQVRFWAEFDNSDGIALPGMNASLIIRAAKATP